ncbi:zinc ribbon domain-containing protein [Phosphitispora sp. TUW77]|uniref:zinc ribbon domain-containing protein n=1 Tax=Phosphitispora sp. TUW77 TaxID=3152361 RepID=UPI003AB1B12B
MGIIACLWEIQNLNENSLKIQQQMKSIPEYRELKELKTEIETRQKEVHSLKKELELVKKDIGLEEESLAAIKTKIEKASNELYGGQISSSKELESAEKNLTKLREQFSVVEEKILIIMENADNYEEKIKNMISSLEDRKHCFKDLNSRYKTAKEEIQSNLAEVASRRDKLRAKVPPEELDMYENLCSRFKDGKGIAALQGGICLGCNMSVSFDILKKVKIRHDVKCDNCGRLLIIMK